MLAMNFGWKFQWMAATLAWASASWVVGQGPVAAPRAGVPRTLTLDTPRLRSSMERMSLAWLIPAQMPDFRLKVERPAGEFLPGTELDTRFRGVEFRLPMEGLWVGYDAPVHGEEPRATFSIRRGF
jgi:hypothetical protein